jgi:hypothetical protein
MSGSFFRILFQSYISGFAKALEEDENPSEKRSSDLGDESEDIPPTPAQHQPLQVKVGLQHSFKEHVMR